MILVQKFLPSNNKLKMGARSTPFLPIPSDPCSKAVQTVSHMVLSLASLSAFLLSLPLLLLPSTRARRGSPTSRSLCSRAVLLVKRQWIGSIATATVTLVGVYVYRRRNTRFISLRNTRMSYLFLPWTLFVVYRFLCILIFVCHLVYLLEMQS